MGLIVSPEDSCLKGSELSSFALTVSTSSSYVLGLVVESIG